MKWLLAFGYTKKHAPWTNHSVYKCFSNVYKEVWKIKHFSKQWEFEIDFPSSYMKLDAGQESIIGIQDHMFIIYILRQNNCSLFTNGINSAEGIS